MNCPMCKGPTTVLKTEPTSSGGKARLRRCERDGRFWTRSIEKFDHWLPATAIADRGNGSATAIAVKSQLEGGGGVSSLSPLLNGVPDPIPSVVDSPIRARVGRKGRGDAVDYPSEFETVWAGCIPHKGNKEPAFKEWLKHKPDPTLTIAVYLAWTQTDQWRRGYIPHLRKWLHEKGWQTRPSDADMSGPVTGPRQAVPFAVAAEESRSSRALASKLRRWQDELSLEPPPPDPRQEYAQRMGVKK